MTRKVILYIATSLDGFIADEEGQINWLESATVFVEEDNRYADFYQGVDTVIMGRTTYDQVVNELFPEIYPYENCQSYVLTSRPSDNHEGISFIQQDVVTLVQELKVEKGKDIWLVGGSSVVMPLIKANLIDEYQLSTLPIILGKGIPLFQEMSESVSLETKNVTLKNGIVTSTYGKK